MVDKEPVYVRYVELTPLCERVLDKMERGSKDREAETLLKAEKKLEAVKTILSDVCEHYGTDWCQEGVCDVDPNGWEGCLTQKILKILEAEG